MTSAKPRFVGERSSRLQSQGRGAIETMIAQLDERENALLSLFLGTKSTEEHVFTLEVTPQQTQQTLDLFRFSRYLGLVDANDVAGTPIQLQISDQATLPETEESPKKKKEVEDLRYRIPSNAAIRIFDESRVWFTGIVPIAQFGRIDTLAVYFSTRNSTPKCDFLPQLAALKSSTLNSSPSKL